jgi:hypothetical protein
MVNLFLPVYLSKGFTFDGVFLIFSPYLNKVFVAVNGVIVRKFT